MTMTTNEKSWTEEFKVKGEKLVEKVKKVIHEGNVNRLIIKKGNDVIVEMPVTAAVVGAIISTTLFIVAAAATLIGDATLVVQRKGAVKKKVVKRKTTSKSKTKN